MSFNNIIEILNTLEKESVEVVYYNEEELSIEFNIKNNKIYEFIVSDLEELNESNYCELEIQENLIKIKINKESKALFYLNKIVSYWKNFNFDVEQIKTDQFGLNDPSLLTVVQISNHLKKRNNLAFAIVWTENNGSENIFLEGNGNRS